MHLITASVGSITKIERGLVGKGGNYSKREKSMVKEMVEGSRKGRKYGHL